MTESISTNTMNSYRNSILSFLLLFTTVTLQAQTENCSNGTDDDGDGLIDCYDGDCSTDGACDDFFFGNQVICADDIDVTTFAIRQQWTSADETSTSHATPAIGDLDGNGIPEVVTVNNKGTLDLFVLNGATGATIASADIGFTPENAPIVAEIDGDEIGDIIVSQNKGDDVALYNVDFATGTLTQRWRQKASVNQPIGLPGVADFDEDGDVEIYYRNEVMDALTGNVIIPGDGNWEQDYVHGTIAVDIFPSSYCSDCAGLELVSGKEIWSINEAAGTRTLVADMDTVIHSDIDPNLNYYPKYYPSWDDQWSTVSAADYNLDGNIDLIITGALGTTTEKYNGETTIFFWDVANSNVITYHDPTNNFVRGPGRVNIGDVDGDGQLNANFVMDQKLYSLDENFNVHWIHPIKEGSSGFTGCSLFDFDGDGAVEVVYRSEESLLIVDGVGNGDNTTSERREIACVSRTQEEYPIIADVDGDGSSEICLSCYYNNSTPFSPYNNTQYSAIRVYESDGEAWMPARGVWNQHGYYNVNINDDLTVPEEVQDHSVVFSNGLCEYADGTPVPFPSRPLNTFLNQAPILNEEGCVEFASPDIDFVGILSATDAACPDAEITVEFEITNIGDVDISGNLPVSYYAGDPTTSNSNLLDTEVTLLEGFDVGETLTITQTISGVGGDFELFVVINDNGGTPPLTVPLPTATIPECETGNNIQSTLVGFQTFDLTVEKLSDNEKCDPTKPDNGQARAYYFGPTPGGNQNIWTENFEDRSGGDKSDTDETAWTSDGGSQTPDFYGVTSYNGSNMFGATKTGTKNDEGIVTWTSQEIDISDYTDINISLDIFENGNQEGSGQWRDFAIAYYELRDQSNTVTESGVLNNGSQFDDFTYEKAFLSNLNSDGVDSLLILRVEIHNTSSSESHYIDNVTVNGTGPDITKEFTEPDGFVFRWYNDDDYSSILYEGSQYPQMATGTYDVVGYYGLTECYSDTVELTIDLVNTPQFNVHVYEISPLTNCSNPDGSLGAFAYTSESGGIPQDTLTSADGYALTWFIQSEGVTPIGTGNTIPSLDAIGYTVEVTEDQSGCTVSESRTVSTTVSNPPNPSVSITDITTCGGTGELSANVGGNTSDYTFEWYDGPSIKPSADTVAVTYTVSDPGEYTVRAILNSSGCISDPVTVTLNDNSTAPNPATTLVQNNTSCVAGNGIISADGDGAGTVTGFTFEWFLGANTLPANALPGTAAPGAFLVNDNTYELGGLEEGTYTVRVTDDATSCFETRTIDVTDTPGSLTVDAAALVKNDINSCDPSARGSIDASGVVPGDVNNVSIGNINSDFEQPDISEAPYNKSTFSFVPQDEVPGWSTTASDNIMELWNDGFQGVPAYSGEQFAEILANQIGALYFDLSTVPNSLFSWTFAHRGRGGTDNIRVSIGAVGSEVAQGDFATGNSNWAVYSGNYTVPTDQFVTRFQFESLDAGSVGNFVDSVTFVLFPYRFELYEGSTVSGAADYINTSGEFNDLDDGDYVLVVYDNLTGCGAVEIPFTIERDQTQPTIATSITDDNNCDNDAGSVDVTADMPNPASEPSSYTYEIFDGHSFTTQIGADETIADGTVPFTFSNLAPGDYRIRVTNDDTQCTNFSDIVVDDVTVTPTFTATQTINDNTSCDAANPNGFLSVSIQGDAESNYNFTWYSGTDATGTVLAGPTVGDNDLGSLASGDYTVVAEHIATGCETVELTLNVDDDPYIPNIVITQDAAQTDCGTGNGELSAYIDNDPDLPDGTQTTTGFTFQWQLDGVDLVDGVAAANGSVPSGSQTANVSGLIADEYTLVVTHDNTDCPATESFTLTENQTIPTLSLISTQDNAGCDPSSNNGEILVSASPAGTYDFDYFYSNGTQVTDGGNVSGSNTNNLTGITDDTYKVVATSTLSCSSDTLIVVVAANPATITVNGSVTNQTSCSPSTVDPNGQITVTPNTSSGEPAGGYDIQWYFGSGTSNTLDAGDLTDGDALANASASGVSTLTVEGLEAGTYTVEVTNTASQCSETEEFTVNDASTTPTFNDPAVDVAAVDMTDCAGGTNYPNGGVTVDLSAITGSGNYSVNYYYGGSALPANQLTVDGSTNIFAEKGTAGTAVISISETTDNTTSASITGIDPGDYTVEVIDNGTGCTTAEVTVTVAAVPNVISVNGNIDSHQTTCVPSTVNPNGEITVTPTTAGGEPAGGYDIQWYFGSGTSNTLDNTDLTDGDALGTTASASGVTNLTTTGLEAGTYTVQVTNVDTRCSVTEEFTIDDDSTDPTFAAPATDVSAVNMTDCSGGDNYPNGGVTVDLSAITGSGNYTVNYFYGGSALPANQLDVSGATDIFTEKGTGGTANANIAETTDKMNTASVSGLDPGDYTVVVIDDGTGCATAEVTVTVNAAPAVISANGNIDSHQTTCVPSTVDPNGQITVTPTTAGGEPAGGYDIQWYFGSGTSNTLDAGDLTDADALAGTSATGATTLTVQGLEAGTYTVQITNDDTKCPITEEFTINDNSTTPTFNDPAVDVAAVDMTDCAGGDNYPNGGITIDLSAITGSGTYSVNYYYGGAALPANQLTVDGSTNIFTEKGIAGTAVIDITETTNNTTSASVTGLNPGDYTIEVIDSGTGCATAEVTVTVNAAPAVISANGNIDSHQTTCVPSTVDPNGQITVTPTTAGGEPAGGYDIQWYFGSGTSNTLDAGDLTDADALAGTSATGATTLTVQGLEAGTYTVQITNDDTKCPITEEFTINDNSTTPTFNDPAVDVAAVDMTDCAGGDNYPNGGITIDLSAITGSGTYSVNYYYGGAALPANQLTVDGSTNIFTEKGIAGTAVIDITETTNNTTSASVTGLNPGDYTIEVIDSGTGCATAEVTVTVNADPAVISANGNIDSHQTTCVPSTVDPNGQITVTPTTAGGEPAGGYDIQWFFGSGTSNTLDAGDLTDADALAGTSATGVTTLTVQGLEAGTYTVQITNDDTKCPITEEFTINDNSTTPTFNDPAVDVAAVDMTDCAGGDNYPNGGITIDLSAITGSGTYSVNYYYGGAALPANQLTVDGSTNIFTEKGIAGTAVIDITETTNNTTSASVTGLNPGDYTIEVIDSGTGCATAEVTVTVNADPAVISANGNIDSHQTTCVPSTVDPNGQITVTPTTVGGEPAGGYDIQWFFGSGTSNTLDAGDLTDADALAGTSATGVTTLTVQGLEAGTYTVQITNDDTKCPITEEFTINDNSTTPTFNDPAVDVAAVDMTDCAGGDNYPNGGITIDLSAITGSGTYSVNYYYGGAALPANQLTVDGSTNIFTEKGIAGTAVIDITETTNNTTSASVTGLNPGDYTIEVIDSGTGCATAEVTVTVNADPAVISANGNIDSHQTTCVPSTVDPNGQITVTPTTVGGEPAGGYDIQWFFGSGTSNTLDAGDLTDADALAGTSATGVTTLTVQGLEAGTYTVQITNDDTKCPITEEFTINDNSTTPTFNDPAVDVAAVDMTDCAGGDNYPNGGITIDLSAITGSGTYSVNYYYGGAALPANQLTVDGSTNIFTEKGIAGTAVIDITETTNNTTSASVTGLNPGDYTIEVIDSGTGCATAEVTVTVNADPAVISANGNIDSHQTTCVPSTVDPNGQITVTPTTAGGEPAGGYNIQWYFGSGTSNTLDAGDLTDADALAGTSATGVTTLTVQGLEAGTYTVQITNDDTKCPITEEFTINDNSTTPTFNDPAVDVAAVDMTDCAGGDNYPNGGVTVDLSAITGSGNYTVNYFYGSSANPANQLTVDGSTNIFAEKGTAGTANISISETTDNTSSASITGIDPGNYTVEVIDNGTGCTTAEVTVSVVANPNDFSADINASVTNEQSSCDSGNPIGQIEVDVLGATTGYTFQLYPGQQNSTGEITSNKTTTATEVTFNNLAAGTYTMKVTNSSTNCFYSEELTIVTSTTNPVIGSAAETSSNTSCNNPTGEITVTANNNGSVQPLDGADGYTFELYEGTTIDAGETPTTINENDGDAVFGNLSEGNYVIRAIDNNTGCFVETGAVVVTYTGPTATFDESSFTKVNISDCFDDDGEINVSAGTTIGGAHTGDIVITWYAGTDTSAATGQLVEDFFEDGFTASEVTMNPVSVSGVTIQNGELIGLPAISYTGVARLDNGCIEVFSTSLTFGAAPDVSLAIDRQPTRCEATYNGAISITLDAEVGNNPAQYRYFIYEGDRTIVPDTDGTPWNPNLSDPTYAPVLTSGSFSDTDDGDIETLNELSIGHSALGELEAGLYTVAIEFFDGGLGDRCPVYVGTITLDEPPVSTLTLDLANTSNNTICDVSGVLDYNGVIEVDASNPAGGTFDFVWYYDSDGDGDFTSGQTLIDADGADEAGAGSNVVGFETLDANTAIISGLGAGWYRVIANNDNAGAGTDCPDTLDIQLFDELTTYSVGNSSGVDWNKTNQVDCNGFGSFSLERILQNGSVNVNSDTQAEIIADFTLSWTNVTTSSVYNPNVNEASGNDLTAGDYEIEIVNDATGCSTTYNFTIQDNTVDPIVSLSAKTADTYCDGTNNTGDGSITIEIDDEGVTTNLADFSVEWYRGTYTTAPGTGDDDFIADDADADDTNSGNTNAGSALVNGNILSLDGLENGTYTVFITKDNGNTSATDNQGCSTFATFTINSDQPVLTVSATSGITVVDNDNCTPENGSITIDEIIVDGTPVALDNTSPYTINWTATGTGNVVTSGAGAIANDRLEDVGAGTYSFNISHNTTGCATGTIDVVVDDIQVDPVISLNTKAADTYCDGTNNTGDGSITINITEDGGSAITLADYSIEWYRGTYTTAPGTGDDDFIADDADADDTNSGNTNAGSALVNGNILSLDGLENGTYTVFITKDNGDVSGNGNEGCDAFATFTINSDQPVLTVSATSGITVVDNDNCTPENGSITIDEIIVDGTPVALDNTSPYTINWTAAGTGNVVTSGAGAIANDRLEDVGAGTYSFNISHNTTGCVTGTIDVVVDDIQVDPVISLNTKAADTYCDGTNNTGDGSITINITEDGGSAITLADYSIEWYRGTYTTAPGTGDNDFIADDADADDTNSGNANAGSALVNGNILSLDGLENGTYTVFITKDNGDASGNGNEGCDAFATFTINSDQPVLTVSATSGITVVDNDNCTPENGSITIDEIIVDGTPVALDNTSPYTINWTATGTGNVVTSGAGAIANDRLEDVGAGTYSFNISHNTTGCATGTIDVVVDDIQVDPVISLNTKAADTYCDGTNNTGDGSITINITEDGGSAITLADYSIEWYRGTYTTAPGTGDNDFIADDADADDTNSGNANAGSALVNGNILSLDGLENGTYTVFITKDNGDASGNGNEGCDAFATFTINSDQPVLTVSATSGITVVDNDNCTPENGSITIDEIIVDGTPVALDNTSPYTINWTATGTGNVVTSGAGAIANDRLEDVGAGTYSFNISHNTTGCVTGTIDVVVDDIQVDPVISLNTKAADTYCDGTNNTGDGSITINITEDGGSAITLADYSIEWYRGTYTTAPGTGDNDFIADDADADDTNSGNANAGSALVNGNILSLDGLENGTYTVFITKDNGDASGNGNEGCDAFATFTINSDQPVLTVSATSGITVVDNDNCTPENGSITIDEIIVDGTPVALDNTSPYTINWTATGTGNVVTSGAGAIANDRLEDVGAGTYSFNISHNTTGCATGTIDVVVDDIQVDPVISLNTKAADTYCDGTNNTGDGSITINITEDGGSAITLADYSIEWYRGTYTTAPGTGDNDFIADDADADDTNSGNANAGSALVNGNILSLDGLENGTYTVFITKDNGDASGNGNEGCDAFATFTINSDQPVLTVSATSGITVVDNDNCTPENGSITIDEIIVDGTPVALDNTSPYTINWTATGTGNVVTSGAGAIANDRLEDVGAGTYSFNISHNTTGCVTGTIDVVVDDIQVDPVISLNTKAADTYCDGTNNTGDGSITINITEDGGSAITLADYSIEWYRGTYTTAPGTGDNDFIADDADADDTNSGNANAGSALVNGNILSLDGLENGTYTVFITKDNGDASGNGNEGCDAFATFTINSDQPVLTVSATSGITVVDNDNCTPENGSITIDEIIVDGTPVALDNTSPYTINWTATGTGNVVTSGAGAIANDRLEDVGAGTYSFNISHNTTGCVTGTIDVVVDDIQVDPVISLNTKAADTYCDGTNNTGDGSITINITEDGGSAITLADYSIEWYRGTYTTAPGTGDNDFIADDADADDTNSGNANAGSALVNGNILSLDGLENGTYTVFITKDNGDASGNGNEGCDAFATFTINSDETLITVDIDAGVDVVNNDNCSPANGSITINQVIVDGGAPTTLTGASPYVITWTNSGSGTVGTSTGGLTDNQLTGLSAGTYSFTIAQTAATGGCSTGTINVVVEDTQVDPVITLNTSSDDTYCDTSDNNGTGAITINITEDGDQAVDITDGDYSVEWYRGTFTTAPGLASPNFLHDDLGSASGANVGSAAIGTDIRSLTGLETGNYTVFINKNNGNASGNGNEGCDAFATFTIGSSTVTPTLNVSDIQARTLPDTLCTGNSGRIVINDADIDGVLDDYDIVIRQGSATGTDVTGSPFNGNGSPSITINSLAADDYFIIATDNTTGCAAATAIVNVKDSVRNPQVALVSMTSDQDCGTSASVGGLEVLVDGKYNDANAGPITFLWEIAGGGAIGGGVTTNQAALSGVSAGNYQVTVTNTNTDCSRTRTYTITSEQVLPSISRINVVDNIVCDDDNDGNPVDAGSFAVTEVTFDGNTFDTVAMGSNYQLEVFALPGSTPVTDNDASTPYLFEQLASGDYRAVITRLDSDCDSEGLEFTIEDVVTRPIVKIALQVSDSTCSGGGTPNGTLRATATVGTTSGIDDSDADYTFQWYLGSGTGTPLANGVDPGNGSTPNGVATSDLSGMAADTYTVEVTRLSTGCVTTEEFELPNVPTNVEILTATATDATTCAPGDGVITITSVNRDNLTDYTFDYYDVDPTSGSPTPVFSGTGGAAYTTATAGTYWIIGTNTLINCTTPAFEIEVGDAIVLPTLTLDAFDFQTNCTPDNPNGRLLVLANGQPENATYDFEWYYGTGTSNPLTSDDYTGGANLAGANTNEVSGLAAGFYTVEVTNIATGCSISETYEMTDKIPNPIAISTTASANTNCVNPNGKVAASVITPAPGRSVSDYQFYWFVGSLAAVGPNPNPANADFTGSLVENLEDGNYVVLVIDQVDTQCQSNATQVIIEDGTESPEFELTTAPVTVCFDRKDGFATVSVPNLSSVDIAWFDDSNIEIGDRFFIDSLDAGMYSVQLTDVITGCIATEVFEILNEAITPNAPSVIVNNGRNNCSIANGSAIANVDGVANNYLFEWFDPSDMNTPYATGSEVFNLDSTTYLVRATNISTGCESPFTSVDIRYEVVDPEFEVLATNSICLRTEDGSTNQFTGTAIISFEEFQLPTDFEWRDSNGTLVGTDSRLIDAYPGDYTVTFTAENGCTYNASFTLETSLTIYNGVSANADGKNDFFLIDCIDYFPGNNVKIYNRAGQKVFDLDGYNNTSERFEGFSNVGGGGLKLPPGTYYYIVDLGTGEDPIQGYLELVR
ncbi:gliding motility-associated C-terminal domain-containing protein [Ekhidna sp.]|uniref:T9SS type B sorting domain-containing protein n=1 Tax=Ekhidna sp. TaxID=2608089 RepID=UPI003CCB8852